MIAEVLRSFEMNLDYARQLLADVPVAKIRAQPLAGMNHAAWIAGHLSYSFQMIGGELGLAPWLPPDWERLFGTGSDPAAAAGGNPDKEQLLARLEEGRRRLGDALALMSEADLTQPLPDERYRHIFPTLGSAVLHVLTAHTAVHLGQLSAWRRAMGLPPVADPM